MSASSARTKGEILTRDALTQLDEAMHKAPCVGLAVDESIDICDSSQLLYVWFFNTDQKVFCEDLCHSPSDQYKRRRSLPIH